MHQMSVASTRVEKFAIAICFATYFFDIYPSLCGEHLRARHSLWYLFEGTDRLYIKTGDDNKIPRNCT